MGSEIDRPFHSHNQFKGGQHPLASFLCDTVFPIGLSSQNEQIFSNPVFRALEIGSGPSSIFEDLNWGPYQSLEKELVALDKNNQNCTAADAGQPPLPFEPVIYVAGNVAKKIEGGPYQLIIDSYCLHCLTDPEERKLAWQNLFKALAPGGVIAGEMMCYHKFMKVDAPYYFSTEESILYKMVGDELYPLRKILGHLTIEKEILSAGFTIEYFMFKQHRKFSFDPSAPLAKVCDPDSLLWIARRPIGNNFSKE